MKNKELFDKTVSILVKAYQNDTLRHGQPCGCAIGNLIAGNNNFQIIKREGSNWVYNNGLRNLSANWVEVHSYGEMLAVSSSDVEYNSGVRELISTGYATSETCSIERAFESPCIDEDGDYMDDDDIDTDGYLGLMSVVDCLMELHEATETETAEAKELFVKIPS